MTIEYHFTCPRPDITLFTQHHDHRGIQGTRRCPTGTSGWSTPLNIDAYHAAIARELGRLMPDARRSAAPCRLEQLLAGFPLREQRVEPVAGAGARRAQTRPQGRVQTIHDHDRLPARR